MNNKVSVVVVTKNRQEELKHCLGSLASQTYPLDELIIIDNNSSDKTIEVVKNFKKNVHFIVRYVKDFSTGYPTIYNRGLKEAKGDWVAFIDDDCVASVNWLREIKKSINIYPKAVAVMGWCGTFFKKNIYSLVTLMFDNTWKQRSIVEEKVLDLEVLDNKNIIYKKIFLEKNSLKYDEERVKFQNGASEDCDLGMQIQKMGGVAICNKKIMIWHKDPQDWLWFIKKYISSWKSYDSLKYKWNLKLREKHKSKQISLMKLVKQFSTELNLNFIESVKVYVVAKQILFLNRVLPILARNKDEK